MKNRPDITEDMIQYQTLVPEFAEPRSKRAAEVMRGLTRDEEGKELPENEVVRNIEIFQAGIRAKIDQLTPNIIWHQKLHPVREGQRAVTVGSTEAEFKKAPRTDLKAFQEILSAPTERMVIGRDERLVTARHIVIDPELITDTLLKNLGLDEYIPEKGTKQAEKVSYRALAIPAIKEMLESLEAFTLSHEQERSKMRYFRLFRVSGGKNGGMVLGTQMINGQKLLFLTDLHGAHRRIDHIHDGYAQEIATLKEIQDTVRDVDGKISREWQQTKDPERIKEVKAQLLGLVDKLQFVTNAHKQKMRDQIEAAVSLETVYTLPEKRKMGLAGGKGKVIRPAKTIVALNPGATRARINTSHLHVGKRIEEIASIQSYLAKDQTRIQAYIEDQTRPFVEFNKTVQALHDQFKIYQLDRPMSAQDRERAISNLSSLKRKCAFATTPIMLFEPYQTFAEVLVEHIDQTIEALRKNEEPSAREEAASEFTKIYLITKIQRFYTELQSVYAEFLSGGQMPNFDKLGKELAKMDLVLSRKSIAPKVETSEYNPVFGELYHLVNSLSKRVRAANAALKEGSDEETVRPYATFLHDRIKDFDFVALMGMIAGPDPKPSEDSPAETAEPETV